MARTRTSKIPGNFRSAQEFLRLAEAYFQSTDKPTVTGLAIATGLNSRQSLIDLQGINQYTDAVKKAKLKVEHGYEQMLISGKNVVGAIFALKNMGWSDQQQQIAGTITHEHVIRLPEKKAVDSLPKLDPSKRVEQGRN